MKYIETLREGTGVNDIYLCKHKQAAVTKNGKVYENVILQDKTGTLDAKIWEPDSPGIDDFDVYDYVEVTGDVTSFNSSLQLSIKRIRKVKEGEYNPKDYLPVSNKDIEVMYRELLEQSAKIQNPQILQLVNSFFVEDLDFVKRFKNHSAAKTVHHGFVGGLLEHTLSVVNLCDYYCKSYPLLNRDLLTAAAMFHDVGKIWEISSFPENDYTDDGQLLGHIVIATEIIGERIRMIPEFSPKVATELKHCILAHHGELEYGSPKKPALIEALALSFADHTDAKMQTMIEVLESNSQNEGWIGYNRFLESNIRKSSK